jgi:adenylate cyclase
MPTPEEFAAAGLYDPDGADAGEQLALLELLVEHGLTVERIVELVGEGHGLFGLAARRIVEGGTESLTLTEAAERAGVTLDDAGHAWRAFGFADPGADTRMWSELDVHAFALFRVMTEIFGRPTALQIARTIGASLSRLADAETGATRSALVAPTRAAGGNEVDVARRFADAAAVLMPLLARGLDAVHRQHVLVAASRWRLWGVRPNEESTTDTIIGFADLVGFTRLSEVMPTAELDRLVLDFEERATEILARPNARLVKLIGDEVMFAVGDGDAAEVAFGLADAAESHPALPALRVGLAAGPVLGREGDYFGSTVNLASRLVKVADPGRVVASADAARRATGGGVPVASRSLGARAVAGFDEPVEVFELTRSVDS